MADVTPSWRTTADRGQMILVAAFGVAVMLVALALILNTSIYTENIATRGSDISGGKDALQYRATTESTLAGAVRAVNDNHTSTAYADYRVSGVAAVWAYENISGNHNARDGVVTNVTTQNPDDWKGAHVYQEDPDGNFTNEDDIGNWTVATDTEGVRDFSMNVTEDSLSDASDPSVSDTDVFHVNFSSSGEYYRVFVYDDDTGGSDQVGVKVTDGDSVATCTADYGSYGGDNRAVINLTNASIGGERCKALEMWHPIVEDPFDLHFNHTCEAGGCGPGDNYNVNGSYSFVLNESYGTVNVQPGTTDPEPYVTSALYSMQVHVVYESKRLYMETDVRAAPGEPDD